MPTTDLLPGTQVRAQPQASCLHPCQPPFPCCHCAAGPADARRSSLLSAIVNSTGPRSSRSAPPGPADPLAGYGVRPHKVGTAQLQDAAGKIYPNQLADSPKAGKPVQGSSFFTASGSGVMR